VPLNERAKKHKTKCFVYGGTHYTLALQMVRSSLSEKDKAEWGSNFAHTYVGSSYKFITPFSISFTTESPRIC